MVMMTSQVREALASSGARVTELFDGVRIELPRRNRQPVVGVIMTVAGAMLVGFMLVWMSGPLRGALGSDGAFRWFAFVFALMGLPGVLLGLALVSAGVAVGAGTSHAVIEIAGGRLRLTEHFGPFQYTWVKPLESIRELRLEMANAAVAGGKVGGGSFAGLVAEVDGAKPFWIGAFYDRRVLEPLADALSELTGRPVRVGTTTGDAAEAAGSEAEGEPEPTAPARTKVRILEQRDAVAIDAPPAGLIRGSHGVFVLAMIWTVFSAGFLLVLMGSPGGGGVVFVPALLFSGLGIAFLVWSVHLGRQRVVVAINAHTVAIRKIGPLGVREQRHPRAELTAVRCGPSGITVNDRPVMELQFLFRDRTKVGCMAHLSERELRWIAAKLRHWLGWSGGAAVEPG